MNIAWKRPLAVTLFILKIVGAVLALILAVAVIVAALVWFKPALVLNSRNLERARPWIERNGISYAAGATLTANSASFWRKGIEFRVARVCMKDPGFAKEACAKDIVIRANADLRSGEHRKYVIDELTAETEPLLLTDAPPEKKEPEKDSEPFSLPPILNQIEWNRIRVAVPELRSAPGTATPFTAQVTLESQSKTQLTFKGRYASPSIKREADVEGTFQSGALREGFESAASQLDLKARYRDATTQSTARLQLGLARERLRATLNGEGSLRAGNGVSFKVSDCKLNATLDPEAADLFLFRSVDLNCPLAARPTLSAGLRQKYKGVAPEEFTILATAKASRAQAGGPVSAEVDLTLNRIRTPLFILDAHARSRTEQLLSSERSKLLDLQLDASLDVPDFRKAAAFSNDIGMLVPAPFHVLGGPLKTTISGTLSLPGPVGALKATLSTDFKSREQALRLRADGDIAFRACQPGQDRGSVKIELVAREARLSLPDIDYTSPPPLLSDPRFVKEEAPSDKAARLKKQRAAAAGECPYDVAFAFRSAENSPLLLDLPLLKKPLPLTLRYELADDKSKGEIAIRNYPVELFRRKGTIEDFRYDLATSIVQGKVRVDYVDYRISLEITGRTDSVQVNIDSDPPLPRQSAFAVLLFGRPLSDAADEESSSAVSVDAAATNGALSLASLYLFASTPIESVQYRPETQSVTAKVKLANGTSLNVGVNDQSVTDVGITRRISKNWRLESTVRNPSDSDNRANETMLEWFKRF